MTLSTNRDTAVAHRGSTDVPAGGESDRLDLAIAGMTCGHCVTAVREALQGLPGVQIHQVGIGTASVTLAPQGASAATLIEAIREAGYEASFAQTGSAAPSSGPLTELRRAPGAASCCSTR